MKMTVGAAAAFALLAASSAAEAADPAIALVLGVKGSPFYQALACGAKAKAKELGLALTISAPDQFAADSQIPVVNAIAATTPVVAAIVPTDAKALIKPMKQLADRGTKIVTIDQTIEDSSFVQTQILTDNAQGGRLAADAINALLDGKGEVLVITQPPGSAAQDARTTGFEEELKKFPGIVYLGAQYQSDDPQKAAEIVTSTLSAHPKARGPLLDQRSRRDRSVDGPPPGRRARKGEGRRLRRGERRGQRAQERRHPRPDRAGSEAGGRGRHGIRGKAHQRRQVGQDDADRDRHDKGRRHCDRRQVRIQGRLRLSAAGRLPAQSRKLDLR